MTILCNLLLAWLIINLAITLYLYQSWYYERRCQADCAHLDGGCERIAFGRAWLTIGRELLVFMFMQLCYPLSWWLDRHQPELPDGDDTPILLVHGFACNSSCLLWLKWRLQQNGHRRVRAVSYVPPAGNVHKLVPQIKRHIRQLLDDTGATRIHYIAHSMGGLLVRDVLADPDFADCIDKVICLGSPHHGSRAANLIAPFVPGAVRQMQYESDYIKSLAATPGSARYFNIHSQMDDLVLPVNSAVVPGMTHLTVDYLGHCSLLYSPRVVALIERCLSDNQSEAP
jgi:triacylglycerol esterase/lipase EstA (alpha/beta hydrolase family)